ncbi:MAG: hypothetical protein KF774_18670 [Planctomyces sp.]|nr:hypothetical protein [Planctomyces sp.]
MNAQDQQPDAVAEPERAPARECGPVSPRPRRPQVPWRTAINFWLDGLLAIVFLTLTWVAAVIRFVFPAGREAYGRRLWFGGIEAWRDAEFSLICGLALLIVLHVMLHWNWVCSIASSLVLRRPPGRDDGARTLLGVGVLVAILHVLAIGLLAARMSLSSIVE